MNVYVSAYLGSAERSRRPCRTAYDGCVPTHALTRSHYTTRLSCREGQYTSKYLWTTRFSSAAARYNFRCKINLQNSTRLQRAAQLLPPVLVDCEQCQRFQAFYGHCCDDDILAHAHCSQLGGPREVLSMPQGYCVKVNWKLRIWTMNCSCKFSYSSAMTAAGLQEHRVVEATVVTGMYNRFEDANYNILPRFVRRHVHLILRHEQNIDCPFR